MYDTEIRYKSATEFKNDLLIQYNKMADEEKNYNLNMCKILNIDNYTYITIENNFPNKNDYKKFPSNKTSPKKIPFFKKLMLNSYKKIIIIFLITIVFCYFLILFKNNNLDISLAPIKIINNYDKDINSPINLTKSMDNTTMLFEPGTIDKYIDSNHIFNT